MRKVVLLIFTLIIPLTGFAHGGGLDSNGGHFNRSTGVYHCHREPCISQHQAAGAAVQEAIDEKRTYSVVYRREDWPHWIDEDNDCQNTRAEVLIRYSKSQVKFKRNAECNVSWGEWIDPYSGKKWTKASDLDIDHIVPLKWAHEHGGANWNRDKKRQFANDMDNLLPVEDNLNQGKGALGPDKWMPPLSDYKCDYLRYWENIIMKYGLEFTSEEKERLGWISLECGININ